MPRKAAKFQIPAAPRKQMAQFVRKLVELLETSKPSVVSWTQGGRAFCIHDAKAFSVVLGRHFRSSQLNNFVRQLNFYAFQKTKAAVANHSLEFSHPLFRRGAWASIAQIKRKTSSDFHGAYEHELKALRSTADELRGVIAGLRSQLDEALMQVRASNASAAAANQRAASIAHLAAQAGVQLPQELVGEMPCVRVARHRPAPSAYSNESAMVGASPRRRKRRRTRTAPLSAPGGDTHQPQPADVAATSTSDAIFSLFEGDPAAETFSQEVTQGPGVTATSQPSVLPVVPMASAQPVTEADDVGEANPQALDAAFKDLSWLDTPLDTPVEAVSAPPALVRGLSNMSLDTTINQLARAVAFDDAPTWNSIGDHKPSAALDVPFMPAPARSPTNTVAVAAA